MSEVTDALANLHAAIAKHERANVLDVVRKALDAYGSTSEPSAAAPARAKAPRAARAPRRGGGKARAKGEKRTPEELDALVLDLHRYILKNQGQRIEPIAAGMGVTTRELNLPMKKLIAERAVTAKGHKRATTYQAR
jgi:hypothetical protein